MSMEIALMKICKRCGEDKDLNLFYAAKANSDGYSSICKSCDNARKLVYQRDKSKRLGKRDRVYTLLAKELRAQGMKRCPGCKTVKALDGFYKSKAAHDKLCSHCIVCANELSRKRPKEERAKRYQQNKDQMRHRKLLWSFGITLDEYNRMKESQGGVCAICKTIEDTKQLAVDHNHKTGKVRQLLCGRCNPAIGFLREDPVLARKLAEYLEYHATSG